MRKPHFLAARSVSAHLNIVAFGHAALCLLIVWMALAPTHSLSAQTDTTSNFDETNAVRAAVLITQMTHGANGQPVISCIGSGTLVSADGLILTNAHLTQNGTQCHADNLLISLTMQPGQPPVASYYANVTEINVGWDLAVLQITRTLDNRPVDRATLALPSVELGDSEALRLDDTLSVVGYSTGDEKENGAAAVRRGTISNFTDEARVGDRAWIKTNATIPGGMSGGAAYNAAGQLIGVPTIEPSPGATEACRLIQDTNGDGRVDSRDSCVPIGGFINALRPARLARGLVRAAQLGLTVGGSSVSSSAAPAAKPGGTPTFQRLLFAPGITNAGMPTSVMTSAPSGTKSLYVFFDYHNMTDGLIYELRTTIDGVPNATFSLAPSTWSGGQDGLWYIGSHEQIWPNGVYVFTLLIEGVRAASAQITIGGAAQTIPTFSDILFGVLDPSKQLIVTGNILPTADTITAEFVYNNIPPNTAWQQVWYYQDTPITPPAKGGWKDSANGKKQVSAASTPGNPLQPGRYRIELYLGDQLAATADFVMAGGQAVTKVAIFSAMSFASDVTGQTPTGASLTFANTLPHLYATFDWHDLAPSTPWTWRWSVDNNPLFESTQPWQAGLTGAAFWLRIDSRDHLPDGSYTLELLVGGVSMGKATAKVGLGQLPVNTFAQASGVLLQGRVVDADTKQGIAGVSVIVLKTTVAVKDFSGQMSDIDQMAITDLQGNFQFSHLLPRDNSYSIIVTAHGYLSLSTDTLSVDSATKNPLVLSLEMNTD